MSTVDELRAALAVTTMPARVVDLLLDGAPDLWLMSDSSVERLASDLALCHPAPNPGEIRARAVPIDRLGLWRLTVVAPDRPGLLAATTAVVAAAAMPVHTASALTFASLGLAVHSLVVTAPWLDDAHWHQLGPQFREAAEGSGPPTSFEPCGVAEVSAIGAADWLHLLTFRAPDQLGLLSAICRALADQAVSVEMVHATSGHGHAHDLFVVRGEVNVDQLAAALSSRGRHPWAEAAVRAVEQLPVVGGLIGRGLQTVI